MFSLYYPTQTLNAHNLSLISSQTQTTCFKSPLGIPSKYNIKDMCTKSADFFLSHDIETMLRNVSYVQVARTHLIYNNRLIGAVYNDKCVCLYVMWPIYLEANLSSLSITRKPINFNGNEFFNCVCDTFKCVYRTKPGGKHAKNPTGTR